MKNTNNRWVHSHKEFSYFKYGSHALLIQWSKSKNRETLYKILHLEKQILELALKGIIELVPGYHSLTIFFSPRETSHDILIQQVENLPDTTNPLNINSEVIEINVSYDDSVAQDLKEVARYLNLTESEVINIHSSKVYDVHFIGFLPGFLYLGGLDERLNIPRRESPRIRVPAGSVAIAEGQTGIYPIESPGGWHIIGKTDKILFNPALEYPCPVRPGMKVKFVQH